MPTPQDIRIIQYMPSGRIKEIGLDSLQLEKLNIFLSEMSNKKPLKLKGDDNDLMLVSDVTKIVFKKARINAKSKK